MTSRVEVFASVTLPLDEWTQTTPAVVSWVNERATFASAWENAERTEEIAFASDASDVQWLIEPPWTGAADWEQLHDSAGAPIAAGEGQLEPNPQLPRASDSSTQPRPVAKTASSLPPKFDRQFVKSLMAACGSEFRGVRSDLDDLAARARLSAWLPELQLKGGRNTDQTLRLSPTEAEPDRYQVVGGDGVRFEGQVRWTLSQLVFARDELAVARLRGALEVERRRRQQQAMEALSKWLRAWMVLATPHVEAEAALQAWVAESALRAELDWLSQGWFSTHVPAAPEWVDVQVE